MEFQVMIWWLWAERSKASCGSTHPMGKPTGSVLQDILQVALWVQMCEPGQGLGTLSRAPDQPAAKSRGGLISSVSFPCLTQLFGVTLTSSRSPGKLLLTDLLFPSTWNFPLCLLPQQPPVPGVRRHQFGSVFSGPFPLF